MVEIAEKKTEIIKRMRELKKRISEYENIKDEIKTGLDIEQLLKERKRKILKHLNSTNSDWKDYKWQLSNSISNVSDLDMLLSMSESQKQNIELVGEKYRFSISPYYLSLINLSDPACPIRSQSIPSLEELDESGSPDPVNEIGTTIKGVITRRYPDRLTIKVTNACGTFCRHCQRKRLFGQTDSIITQSSMLKAIEYIKSNDEIRDVLLTGGDALLIPDDQIEWILSQIRKIKHVEIIRLGTRTPVTLPQRITKNLVNIIKKHHPVLINTQFNHPLEITRESKEACDKLSDAGIPLGNQMVLLNGINNDKHIVKKLNQKLLMLRVKPYYIFHPKRVRGTKHFWVSIKEGIAIMDSLRGYTSGLAVPYYIYNAPGALGKTPLLPNYLLSSDNNKLIFRNWEGKTFEVDEI